MNFEGVCVSVFGSYISWVSVCGMIKPAYSELSTWTHLQILFLDFPDLRQRVVSQKEPWLSGSLSFRG